MPSESEAREEAQEYYIMRFYKNRDFALSGRPERRGKKEEAKPAWPRAWPRSKMERAELRRLEKLYGDEVT